VDDPFQGFLIRLFRLAATINKTRLAENRVAQTLCEYRDDAMDSCCRFAAAADELATADDDPLIGPEYADIEPVERLYTTPTTPRSWGGMEHKWNEKMKDAVERADSVPSRPTVTTKEVDGSFYYYLQWLDDDTVKTQYIAPVEP
jgi:hypothetical protein